MNDITGSFLLTSMAWALILLISTIECTFVKDVELDRLCIERFGEDARYDDRGGNIYCRVDGDFIYYRTPEKVE